MGKKKKKVNVNKTMMKDKKRTQSGTDRLTIIKAFIKTNKQIIWKICSYECNEHRESETDWQCWEKKKNP